MKNQMRTGLIAGLALILGAASSAWAGPATDQLRNFFTEASRVREDPATEGKITERITAIRRLVHQAFDFRKASELALGPAWEARTAPEQEEFSRLFGSLLERAFIMGFAKRTGIDGPVQVNYLEEVAEGDVVTVKTTVVSRDGGITTYAYRMMERGPGWVVIDVLVDGLSVLTNFRAQFVQILRNSSFGDLLGRIRAKVADASGIWTASVDDTSRAPNALPQAAVAASVTSPGHRTLALQPIPAPGQATAAVVAAAPAPAPAPAPAAVEPKVVAAVEPKVAPQPVPEPEPVAEPAPAVAAEPPAPAPQVASAAREALTHPVRTARTAVAAIKSYWVQVGAFANFETARRLAARLHEWRMPVQTAAAEASQTAPTLSRVRVGPFTDLAEAEAALRALQTRGFTPFIADR